MQRDLPIHVIRPDAGWAGIDVGELWRHRELVWFLAKRDVAVRYKQTALGVAWAVLQPLLMMVVFSIFFSRLAGVPSDGIPYPVFAFAALTPWTAFATGLSAASNSLVGSANLLQKVYFPRIVVPTAAVLSGFPDLLAATAVLAVLLAVYGIVPDLSALVWLPLFAVLAFLVSLAFGVWLSAVNVEYRDVRYTVPFLIQLWMFVTPVAYPGSLVPEAWRGVYSANPMVTVVDGFRWCLVGGPAPSPVGALVSVAVTVTALVGGAFYFRRMERTFADVV